MGHPEVGTRMIDMSQMKKDAAKKAEEKHREQTLQARIEKRPEPQHHEHIH
jgi:hypothetical protein